MSEERGGFLRIADTCKPDNREQGFGKSESFEQFRSLILSLKKEVREGRALERFYPLSPLASKELFFLKGFDRKDRKMYSYPCPAKQKRATLGSDPSRDSRMRLRRISDWGSLMVSLPHF